MEMDPRNVIKLLFKYLEDQNAGPKECHQLLTNLNDLFLQEQLNLTYLDLHLQYMFKVNDGLPDFITNVLSKKTYKSSVIKILEIIYTLINNFPFKLEKYVFSIHDICFKIIKSSLATSDEKVKSLEVINLSFEKIHNKSVDEPEHYKTIYDSLRNSLTLKKSDSVLEKTFLALGTFSRNFQYLIEKPEILKALFLNQIEAHMTRIDCSNKVFTGLFTGFNSFCESFPLDLKSKEDEVVINKLYKYIDKMATPTFTVKVANRAILTFLANNMSLFAHLIIDKFQYWHDTLLKWLQYGPEDMKVGALVLRSYYQGLGVFLSKEEPNPKYQNAVSYFVEHFKMALQEEKTPAIEKTLSLYGFFAFTEAYQKFLKEEEVRALFNSIIHSFEETFAVNQEPSSTVLEFLPNYIQTIAKFVQSRKITNSELFCLHKGVVIMIKTFPQLPYSYHACAVDSLVFTFHFLASNDEKVFNSFVENVVYQGVVWTCSHKHVSEAEILERNSDKIVTVKNYEDLWRGLLKILPVRKYDKSGIYLDDRKYILIKIIEKLIRTMLILINKLNVSISLTDANAPVTDIESAYKVAEINDFAIFLNVVDFYQDILEFIEPAMMKKCICKLIHHLMSKCIKNPLISGFYKLLSFCLKICKDLNYFNEMTIISNQDASICYHSLQKFLHVLLNKIKQLKGDLLIACLQVLLEYPTLIIREALEACVAPFRIIFEVGRNYIKLTDMAVTTLEHWQNEIPAEEMERFLAQVIPLLDFYLRSKSLGGSAHAQEKRRKTAQALNKRRIVVEIEPELLKLQKKILNFVGKQSSSLCQAFVFAESNVELAMWGNRHHLKVSLPYEDVKLDVYMDKLLPRVIDLALNSTERRIRVMACELLQAEIMVFLGTTKKMPQSVVSDLNELLRHIAFPLLKLGCDLDQVVEQLFRPLFFQLIHWYTHPTQIRGEHSAIVIEAMMEGITHPSDSALRDFSGQCVNEFVKWTIKQASESSLAHDPVNIKVLLKNMRFFSAHPDPFKKLGAALIFNNIYREVREESALLSMFWIEFLHIFVKSLSVYENKDDENCVGQINSALTHIERGFVEKSALFNKPDTNRRTPVDIRGGLLKDVSVWLLLQTGSKSPYCRDKCMELFCNITPYTKGYQNLQDFISKNVNENPDWIAEIYEQFLIKYPDLQSLRGSDSDVNPIKWVQGLLGALSGYSFVIKNNLVSVNNFLSNVVLNAIRHFVNKVSVVTLDGALALIQTKEWMFNEFEKQEFDKHRATCVEKLFEFFTVVLSVNQYTVHMDSFYGPELWNLVLNSIFNKQTLGFEIFIESDDRLTRLIEDFMKKLPNNKLIELVNILNKYIAQNLFIDVDFRSNIELKHRNMLKGLIMLQSFNLNDLQIGKFANGLIAALLNRFFIRSENGVIYEDELQHTTLNYCLSVFDFALENDDEFKIFVEFLYKPYNVQTVESHKPIHFGIYVLTIFEDSVLQKIIEKFDTFLDFVLMKNFSLSITVELILYMLSYLSSKKQPRKCKENVVQTFLTRWDNFEVYFNEDVFTIEKGIDVVKYLLPVMRICNIQHASLNNWLIYLLTYDQNISSKDELDMKVEIFTVIMDILEITNDDENMDLRTNLNCFKSKFFSESSSVPLQVKVTTLDKLLTCASRIRTPTLLTFLLDIYVRTSTEKSSSDVKSVLKEYMLRNVDSIQAKTLIDIYEMCYIRDLDCLQKYKLMSSVVPLFQYSTIRIFEDFFVNNISKIISNLKEEINETNMPEKILHFILLEVLFLRCPIDSADTEPSKITQAALPNKPDNKSLFLQLFKCTLDAFKNDNLTASTEIHRLYKCHAYNAMVSIVSNSIKDANFYTKLFIRQENNIDILWSNLVDVHKNYVFETDFETIPKRKKVLVNIRDEMRARRRLENRDFESVKYMESMRVFNSSLSEDLTKFDFTNNIVRSQLETDEEIENKTAIQSEIELDCTDVNTHECMASVCGLIDHMVRTKITELPSDEDEDYTPPAWVKAIRALLLSPDTHANVKIFWVKVIDNTVHVLQHFAKWFLEPLLKFLVDRCAGKSMNYFVTDVVAILAAWSSKVVPSEETEVRLAAELLAFLIGDLNNERPDMFKYHLELIRLLVEAWKTSIRIPYELIFSKLNVDVTSRKVEIGIHLTSILLANNIAPWEECSYQDYCKILFNVVMKNKHRVIYKPCSETIGLVLKFSNGQQHFSKMINNVHILLKKIEDIDKYAHILEAIVLRYPQVADEFHLHKILSRIHAVPKDIKLIYLKIILSRHDVMGQISDFKTEKWDTYIENDNLDVQLLALEVVHKCLDVLKTSANFNSIIQSVCKHVSHPNVLCRSRMYDIAIQIYKNKNLYKEVVDFCEDVLIQGITDSDEEIHDKVLDFWQNAANLPAPIAKRFPYILSHLYKTNTENDFLGFSAYLLLDVIKKTDGYNEILFEHPLEDCDFEEYQLQTNWRARHLSVVPLFAETLQSLSESGHSYNKSDFNRLRQTQTSLEFQPTQSLRAKQITQFTMSESSLYVKSEEESAFVDPNQVTMSYKYRIPKRRFLRDKTKIHKFFAHQEVQKSVERVEKRKDLAKERENKVKIYRNYRKGDLPDIQIALHAVLQPLQALTLHDDELANILYLEVYNTIFNKMKKDEYMKTISEGIVTIFTRSTEFNRNLFRTLLDTLLLSEKSIVVDPSLVSSVSRSTGLTTLGVLLLEEYLTGYCDDPTDTKRSRGQFSGGEVNCWVKLAELYKEMDEWDVVKAIFLEKMSCEENVNAAILAESRKQWQTAKELYEELIRTDETYERRDFYYESYFKCFAHLGDWGSLVDSIHKFTSEESCWSELWDQDFNQQKLLPWYINGQLKNALFSGSISHPFLKDLNDTFNSEHVDYVQNNFAEELAMIWLFMDKTDEAEQYVKAYIDNFLDYWQLLNALYTNLRYKRILKLRNIVDIHKFITVFNNFNIDTATQLKNLISYWNRTNKENLPSILLCEERVLYRKQFITVLKKKISLEEEDLEDLINELDQVKFSLDECLMTAAIEEGNFAMAKKYLTIYDCNVIAKLKLPFSKLAVIRSKTKEFMEKFQLLLHASNVLSSLLDTNDRYLKIAAHLQLFSVLGEISVCCEKNDELLYMKKEDLSRLIQPDAVSSAQDISLSGLRKLKTALLDYESEQRNKMEPVIHKSELKEHEIVASSYVQLAYFVKEQGVEYFTDFMLFVLKAMKFDSSEGRQLFPCILMKPSYNEEEKKFFVEEIEKIPVWMFLGWIPQLLVNVDSCKVSAVAPLILKIAKTYPQSIMYAYRLSKENYTFQNNPCAEETKVLIKSLDKLLLSDDRIDKFLKALSFVGVPASILMYYVRKLIRACQSNENEQVKLIQETILSEVFSSKPDSRDVNAMQGNMFKKIEKFKREISNITKSNNATMIKNLKKLNEQVTEILKDAGEMKRNSRLLKDYSPWLASFSANNVNLDLEIPGQYDGKRIPQTQHHIKISGFNPTVTVIGSLRKPIKVTILGNDTKEYPFLVKFGEDVRQDQRIQQLFSLMNNIFENDKNLNEKFFSILTYQVVPLTSSLGMIQWINGTIPLQEFIEKPLKGSNCFEKACDSYQKFVHRGSANRPVGDVYGTAAVNNSRDKTIANFRALELSIQMDVLRTAFLSLSANTESFAALRNNFIRSYAVMCVGQWILGVGDRHLSNSLICQKDGKVLGVDFGHAFGTATQILPVPELVPFRLTPHIVALMEPLRERGLFRETMIHSLRALRRNTGSLLATMNVFVEEPSLDWLEHAARFGDSLNCQWYPAQKVDQAKRKLAGANSTTIMCEDLMAGHQPNQRYLKAYLSLVKGVPQHDVRARKEGDELSVEDQVECLIDHATDYNLLGRMYEGWRAWV